MELVIQQNSQLPVPPPPVAVAVAVAVTVRPRGGVFLARATVAFAAETDTDLCFARGDAISVVETIDTNWWRGKNITTGASGMFPASYVVAIVARAKRDFGAEAARDLGLKKSDTVRVLEFCDANWWRGENIRTTAVGIFMTVGRP